jgi:hypothetical protein
LVAEEPEAKLVDQGVGLERMIRALSLQEVRGDLPQLDLGRLEQPFPCAFIALAPERKPSRDLTRIRHSSSDPNRNMIPGASSFRYYKCCI